jgi:hypothetical protein
MPKSENIAGEIAEEFEQLASQRGDLDSHCQEIAERVIPAHRNQFNSRGMNTTKGEKRNTEVYDATAGVALGRFSSILDSLLTPRNQTWHRVISSNPDLNKSKDVRGYFDTVTQILFRHRYSPLANFASQNQQNYSSLGAYGNGCVFIDKLRGKTRGLRYKNIHFAQTYFMEDHQGMVDGVIRHYPMTARQAIQKWGVDALPSSIAKCTDKQQEFFFLHCVKPRQDYDPERLDARGKPFMSRHVCLDGKKLVGPDEGYESFPYAISRYLQTPGEVYGRSPAMEVLPAIKTLNAQKKTLLKQGQRAADPILLMNDDGMLNAFSMMPGAKNPGAVNADGRPLVHTLPVGNVNLNKDMMDEERAIINDVFLVTIFQIMVESPQMTATEVIERTREKGILLAPTIGRQQSEYLGPLINRELDLLGQMGLLPPFPMALREAKGEYELLYDSPLSRAARAEEVSGLNRSLQTVLEMVKFSGNAEPLDHYDWDSIIPELNDIHGVPSRWMRGPEQIEQIRGARAKAQQEAAAAQAAPGAAGLIGAAAKAAAV